MTLRKLATKRINALCRICAILGIGLLSLGSGKPASTPKETVLHVLEAIRAEDMAALERCFIVPDNKEAAAWMHLLADGVVVRQRLDRLSLKKFGKTLPAADSVNPHIYLNDEMFKDVVRAVNAGRVDTDAADPSRAHLTLDFNAPGTAATKPTTQDIPSRMELKKIGDEWKIDVGTSFNPGPAQGHLPDDLEAIRREQEFFRALFARTLKAWKDAADGIEEGRYKSFQEANAAASRG